VGVPLRDLYIRVESTFGETGERALEPPHLLALVVDGLYFDRDVLHHLDVSKPLARGAYEVLRVDLKVHPLLGERGHLLAPSQARDATLLGLADVGVPGAARLPEHLGALHTQERLDRAVDERPVHVVVGHGQREGDRIEERLEELHAPPGRRDERGDLLRGAGRGIIRHETAAQRIRRGAQRRHGEGVRGDDSTLCSTGANRRGEEDQRREQGRGEDRDGAPRPQESPTRNDGDTKGTRCRPLPERHRREHSLFLPLVLKASSPGLATGGLWGTARNSRRARRSRGSSQNGTTGSEFARSWVTLADSEKPVAQSHMRKGAGR